MTKMMDIIEDYCILRNYGYSRLDGTMKVSDRQEEVCSTLLKVSFKENRLFNYHMNRG